MSAYERTLARLFALRRFGVRPGLDAISDALAKLGDPQRAFDAIHVAGSNGKGSTSAMIESVLRADGRRTGLYTSPHLARFTERIRVGGAELDRDAVAPLFDEVTAAGPGLTFFELVTAMAFLAFARAGVEVAVIEVGLGGRWDATNVLPRTLVSVITGIALEHTEVLGTTLDAIAREKAGILRAGVPAVIGAVPEEARRAIAEVAARVGTKPRWLDKDFARIDSALLGEHQRGNAAVARAAVLCMPVPPRGDAIARGLASVRWPGRMEVVADDVLVDGAHNPDGASALAAALPMLAAGRAIHLVIGVVEDKDVRALFEPLLPLVARVFVTTAPSPRARTASSLASLISHPRVTICEDPLAAVAQARVDGALCVVAGSLFLVGAVRARLLCEDVDPIAAQDPAARP
ncbi:MAG: folylpolyglutamate synthase/dihydrofolate synthase family protein [Polyangia bacterium]